MNLVGASLLQGSQARICNISMFLCSQIFFEVCYVFFFSEKKTLQAESSGDAANDFEKFFDGTMPQEDRNN